MQITGMARSSRSPRCCRESRCTRPAALFTPFSASVLPGAAAEVISHPVVSPVVLGGRGCSSRCASSMLTRTRLPTGSPGLRGRYRAGEAISTAFTEAGDFHRWHLGLSGHWGPMPLAVKPPVCLAPCQFVSLPASPTVNTTRHEAHPLRKSGNSGPRPRSWSPVGSGWPFGYRDASILSYNV